jgi:hypothetical protein
MEKWGQEMARMLDFAPFFNLLRSAVAIYWISAAWPYTIGFFLPPHILSQVFKLGQIKRNYKECVDSSLYN